MTDTLDSLRRKVDSATELGSVVRTMKALAAASAMQYEHAVAALDDYYRTVELGMVAWLRQMTALHPLLKVPEHIEVSLREKEGSRVYFLLNHQNSPIRVQFYKPMHDFLTGNTISGNYDLPPHGVLVP